MAPRDGRPDSSVGADGGYDLPQTMDVLVKGITGLQVAIDKQITQTQQQIDMQQRYAMSGAGARPGGAHQGVAGMIYGHQPRISEEILGQITAAGAPAEHMTGMTQVSPMGALSSLQNLQSYTAQQLGQWVAGTPLYNKPGSTPAGTPRSTSAPAGSGARAASPSVLPAGVTQPSGTGWPGAGGGGGQQPPGGGQAAPGGAAPGGGSSGGSTQGPTTLGQLTWQSARTQLGGRLAVSGGSKGVMGQLRRLPVIGAALDIAGEGAKLYTSQREAGRGYQEAEGGSNLAGQAERGHAAVYEASMFGRMPEGVAAQAFNEVTSMGFNRAAAGQAGQQQNRQSALNFVYHNYTGTGMDVNDSVKVLQTVSQNATISLNQVSSALKSVSDTAGKAGTNAQQARQNLDTLMQAAISTGAGAGAPVVAGAVAASQASYGKGMAGTSFAGQLSSGMQYMMSGQYGITPAQTQYIERTQPQQYARMLTGSSSQMIQNYFTSMPDAYQSLKQMIGAAGGHPTGDEAQQIATQFLNQWQPRYPQLDENVMAQYFNQVTGIQLTPNNVMQWVVGQVAGTGTAAAGAKAAGGTPAAPVSAGTASKAGSGGAATGRFGLAQQQSPLSAQQGASSRFGAAQPQPKSWQQVLTSHAGSAGQAYLSQEQKTGKRDPVLEALQQNLWAKDQVQVQTKSGPRVMSFTDAMKNYPEEMAAGQATFYSASGKTKLGTTSQVTHGLVNQGADYGSEMTGQAGSNKGVPLSKYQKQHPASRVSANDASTAGGKGTVTVQLSQEARQLLQLLPSSTSQATAQSTVPSNIWAQQASR